MEQDLEKIIKMNRFTQLILRLMLKSSYQQHSVNFFKRYVMDDNTKEIPEDIGVQQKMDKSMKQLIDGFAPRIEAVDRRIFYEITGTKINERAEFIQGGVESDSESDEEIGEAQVSFRRAKTKKTIDIN